MRQLAIHKIMQLVVIHGSDDVRTSVALLARKAPKNSAVALRILKATPRVALQFHGL